MSHRLLSPLVLTLLSLALAACATTAPAPATWEPPAAWTATVPAPGGVAVAADWWRGFQDAGINDAVQATLQANTDLAVARANLQRARALSGVARAALLPAVQVSASAQRNDPASAATHSHGLFDGGFDAAWEPDFFGGNQHAATAAAADSRASALTLAATQVSLAAEAVADVVQLRGTETRLALARDNLAAQEETLQITRWRQQAGLVTSLEVEQARSAVEQTRAQLPSLTASAAQTRHALAVLMGLAPLALPATLLAQAPLPTPPAGWSAAIPAQLLRQRPDVAASEAQLQAAAQRVAQADAARRPQLALRASLAWSALTLSGLGSATAVSALVGSVAQPLFDGGQRNAQLAAQQASFDAAAAAYQGKVLVALQDVEDAFAALAGAHQRLAALRQAEEASSNAALLSTQRFTAGVADFQTVLDTQRSRLSVQDSRAVAEADWVTAHVRLVKALGGGWVSASTASE